MASDCFTCLFCGSLELVRTHSRLFHKQFPQHGPFDFFQCGHCGSGMTLPTPSCASLAKLYGSYNAGLPGQYRSSNPEDFSQPWHTLAVSRIKKILGLNCNGTIAWIDIGAGGGELAVNLARSFPHSHGMAVDLHDYPDYLAANAPAVVWRKLDINSSRFASDIKQEFDIVLSTAVLEHIISPLEFITALIGLIRPGGMLYLICPNYGSIARKALGESWPYFSPGEHLAMPTSVGAIECIMRAIASVPGNSGQFSVVSRPVALLYPFKYILERLGVHSVAQFLPKKIGVPLPVGALETYIIRQQLKEQ